MLHTISVAHFFTILFSYMISPWSERDRGLNYLLASFVLMNLIVFDVLLCRHRRVWDCGWRL